MFNGSAKSSSGISLNECMMTGSPLLNDLLLLLLRFRSYRFVLTAAIEKIYRQILVHPEDTLYQKIMFRKNFNEPVMNTVWIPLRMVQHAPRILRLAYCINWPMMKHLILLQLPSSREFFLSIILWQEQVLGKKLNFFGMTSCSWWEREGYRGEIGIKWSFSDGR